MPRAKAKQDKKKKRHYYAELRIDVKHYPTTMYEILEALFKRSRPMVDLAYYLVKRARAGGWEDYEWLKVLLEFLKEYSKVYNLGFKPEDVEALLSYYDNLIEYSNTTRNEKVMERAKALGIDLGTWQRRYHSIIKRLMRAGLIYKKWSHYGQSKEFLNMLRKMEEALIDFYTGKEEGDEWL
uniref:Orf181 n=1 Tax=Pyrococcus sp. JT1 TaxID=165215 RepID=Q977V7_9EURY|nr:hypothetical protein [Pyrococcus sp. JT1]AAK73820.1 Orf181 [Pyrococcus sp. JT1]